VSIAEGPRVTLRSGEIAMEPDSSSEPPCSGLGLRPLSAHGEAAAGNGGDVEPVAGPSGFYDAKKEPRTRCSLSCFLPFFLSFFLSCRLWS